MDIEDFGNILKNIVQENKETILNEWETFPKNFNDVVQKELDKVKKQILDYNKEKESSN